MPNFKIGSKSIRKQIKNIITEKYKKGMPIIKELIQNANDAQADEVHIGWHSGIKDSANILLNHSSLFIINNGKFLVKDFDSINEIWVNEKADNPNQIGKFGLGLKSVFHWCEAFFYFSSGLLGEQLSEESIQKGNNAQFGILNPWASSGSGENDLYPEWEEISKIDYELIRTEFKDILSKMENNWFIVWIPLRRKDIEKEAPFAQEYPGDKSGISDLLQEKELISEISGILPYMTHLKKFTLWENTNNFFDKKFELKNCGKEFHKVNTELIAPKMPFIDSGLIEGLKNNKITYWRNYIQNYSEEGKQFFNNEHFPKNDDNKQEKVFEQGAVSIIITEHKQTEEANFVIDWCVFLPLTDMRYPKKIVGNCSIQLNIHGRFFLDSGRNEIAFESKPDKPDDKEAKIKSEWNKFLAETTILPLIIPTIDKIIHTYPEKLISQFVENIHCYVKEESRKWMKNSICSEWNLLKRVFLSTQKWESQSVDKEFFDIPKFSFEKIDNHLIEKFLLDDFFVFKNEFFGLSNSNAANWTKEMYLKWLDISFEEILKNCDLSKLWLSVISSGKNLIQDELVEYIREIFITVKYTDLKAQKTLIEEILETAKPEFKIYLDLPIDFPQKYFLPLLEIKITSILLNQDFYDSSKPSGNLSVQDCEKILRALSIEDDKRLAKLALSLIKVVKREERGELLENIKNNRLFIIKNEDNNDSLTSWNTISEMQNKGFLFSSIPIIYKELSQTIKNCKIGKLLDNDIKEILNLNPKDCSVVNAVDFIATQKPDLQIMDNRFNLFSKIQNVELDENAIKSIRYLLHSEKKYYDSIEPLFIFNDDCWSNLLFIFLKNKQKEWTILQKEQIKEFNQRIIEKLNIRFVDKNEVQKYIEDFNEYNSISCESLNLKERNEIIRDFENTEILKKIPLFKDISGKLVSISNNTFIVSANYFIPIEIQNNITFIEENKILIDRQICDKISPNSILDIVFNSEKPEKYWEFILETIQKVSNISEDLRKKLRQINWIPLNNGNFGSFELFIHYDGLENIISEINNGKFYDYKMLVDKIKEDEIWEKIKKLNLLNTQEHVLSILSGILLENPDNHFGEIANEFTQRDFDNFFAIFDTDNEIFPVVRILIQIKEKCDDKMFYDNFIADFFIGKLKKQRLISVLKFLQKKECNVNSNEHRNEIMKFYYLYLHLIKSENYIKEVLLDIELKNQHDEWCEPKFLCYGLPDVSKKYLLNDKFASTLDETIRISKYVTTNNKLTADSKDLEEYFDRLAEKTSSDLVGLFLSCFGNDEYIKLANKRYLTNNRKVEQIRKLLNESWADEIDTNNIWDINKVLEEESYQIRIQNDTDGESSVRSIIGNTFKIKNKDFKIQENLHIDNDEQDVIILKDVSYVQDKKKLVVAFHNTFKYHICHLFRNRSIEKRIENAGGYPKFSIITTPFPQNHSALEELWSKFSKAEQNTILEVQKQIVEHLISNLQLLKIDNKIADELFAKDDERRRYEADGGVKELTLLKEDFFKYSNDIFKNPKFIHDVFEAVKEKLSTYQYDKKSVIFELFQNADDAVSELLKMDLTPKIDEFVVNYENATLTIMHWGRKINQDRGGNLTVEISRKRRYNDDVLKMLKIGYSRKDDNQTGKFGLGFKSIYSICDSPKIISGQLGFKISGAIFPSNLDDETKKRLQYKLPFYQSGTIIEMNVKEETNDILVDFEKYAYLQTCFSRSIRSIKVNEKIYSNKLEPIFEINGISKVKVDSESYGLLFKSESRSILFKLDSNGFCRFSKEIPSIWVTVPTRVKDELGLIINAPFDIDVGRTQLSLKEELYFGEVQELGKLFFKQLNDFYLISKSDFDLFRKTLSLSVNLSFYDFWESLFNILSSIKKPHNSIKSIEIAYHIMWEIEKSGYYRFLFENKAIPNGFSGENRALISLSNLKYRICGILSQKTELLGELISMLDNDIVEDINYSGISDVIFSKLPIKEDLKIQELRLIWFIRKILQGNTNVNSERANKLGRFLSDDIFKEFDEKEKEREKLKEYLNDLKFKSLTEHYTQSNEILIMDEKNHEEEYKRGAFAPDEFIISKNYDSNGINFLIFCRCEKGFSANTNKLVNWAVKAEKHEKQKAVLDYILNGNLNNELSNELKNDYYKSSWLKQLKDEKSISQLLESHDFQNKMRILSSLGFAEESFNNNYEGNPINEKPKEIDWQEMLKYWKDNKSKIIEDYENMIYPHFFDKSKLTGVYEDKEVRKNWMILFILGMTHTFGFENPYSYKKFIEILERKNLLLFIANYELEKEKKPEKWIEDYIDPFIREEVNDEEFRIWMKSFSGIYKISKDLSVWIGRFFDGLKYEERNLSKILIPRADPEAYVDVPPLNSTLNMGANFILRELVRFGPGNIKNKDIFKECYVPKKIIREVCNLNPENGSYQDSKSIYNYVLDKIGEENITFDFCFDIAITEFLKKIGSLK